VAYVTTDGRGDRAAAGRNPHGRTAARRTPPRAPELMERSALTEAQQQLFGVTSVLPGTDVYRAGLSSNPWMSPLLSV
jgi:hypothetical protein